MKVVVLGGGESGYGSAVLAQVKGLEIFLSDKGTIAPKYAEILDRYGIAYEEGTHTEARILDADLARRVSIRNEQIETTVVDYGNGNRVLGKTNYAALRSGEIEVGGHRIRTAPVSSLAKAREIAELLRERIRSGKFLLSEPVRPMPTGTTTKKLQIREEPGRNH